MNIQYDKFAWPDIKEAIEQDRIALVPLGCTEEQGPRLPLDSHSLVVTFAVRNGVRRASERFGVTVFANMSDAFCEYFKEFKERTRQRQVRGGRVEN